MFAPWIVKHSFKRSGVTTLRSSPTRWKRTFIAYVKKWRPIRQTRCCWLPRAEVIASTRLSVRNPVKSDGGDRLAVEGCEEDWMSPNQALQSRHRLTVSEAPSPPGAVWWVEQQCLHSRERRPAHHCRSPVPRVSIRWVVTLPV